MTVHGDNYVLDAARPVMHGSGRSAKSMTSEPARYCSMQG